MIDFDALEKEMIELNEKKKAWDKAFDRVWEIWGIVAKHEDEYYEWKRKKQNGEKLPSVRQTSSVTSTTKSVLGTEDK